MAANRGETKLKLLYIKDYLERYSDEDTPVSPDELLLMLREKGIVCERKSIYSDVQTLRDYGFEILRVRAPKNGYCLITRTFEEPELRLLLDAVQAASFITPKKTKELVDKITTLCSVQRAALLKEQISVEHRVKCSNEEIYVNIDVIHRAIRQGKQISFLYQKRQLDDETRGVRMEEKQFTVSPYALIWSNDHYYLISNHAKYNNLMHTRIDRMRKVEMCKTDARRFDEVSPYRSFFDAADYAGKLFNMFSGDLQQIEFVCRNEILEEILDRFGSSAQIFKCMDDDHFRLTAHATVSDGLVSWVMQFADKIEVIEPASLRAQMKERAKKVLDIYTRETAFES